MVCWDNVGTVIPFWKYKLYYHRSVRMIWTLTSFLKAALRNAYYKIYHTVLWWTMNLIFAKGFAWWYHLMYKTTRYVLKYNTFEQNIVKHLVTYGLLKSLLRAKATVLQYLSCSRYIWLNLHKIHGNISLFIDAKAIMVSSFINLEWYSALATLWIDFFTMFFHAHIFGNNPFSTYRLT